MQNEILPVNETAEPTVQQEETVKTAKKKDSRVYAGFFVRFTAFLLDRIIVGVPLLLIRFLFWTIRSGNPQHLLVSRVFFSFTLKDIILYLLSAAYFICLTWYSGQTVGKMIMRIRVVSAEDRKPTLFEIVFRETFARYLSTVILCIGYLIIGAGDEKQALHDYLADTRVVYADLEKKTESVPNL